MSVIGLFVALMLFLLFVLVWFAAFMAFLSGSLLGGLFSFGSILLVLMWIKAYQKQEKENEQAKSRQLYTVELPDELAAQVDVEGREHRVYCPADGSLIVLDPKNQRLFLRDTDRNDGAVHQFTVDQVREISLNRNDNTVTTVSIDSTIGRAIAGELVFGPVGAVIGGLTAKKKTEEKVTRISLRLRVDDLKYPLWEVSFFRVISENLPPAAEDDPQVRAAMRVAEHFAAVLRNMVDKSTKKVLEA